MMLPVPEEEPLTDDGWILTGKATSADAEECKSLVPPPPPPPAAAVALADCPKGNSPMMLEKRGGRLLNMLGVARERMGVVRDSELVETWVAAPGCPPGTLRPPT